MKVFLWKVQMICAFYRIFSVLYFLKYPLLSSVKITQCHKRFSLALLHSFLHSNPDANALSHLLQTDRSILLPARNLVGVLNNITNTCARHLLGFGSRGRQSCIKRHHRPVNRLFESEHESGRESTLHRLLDIVP